MTKIYKMVFCEKNVCLLANYYKSAINEDTFVRMLSFP